jgi:hypothetical protein
MQQPLSVAQWDPDIHFGIEDLILHDGEPHFSRRAPKHGPRYTILRMLECILLRHGRYGADHPRRFQLLLAAHKIATTECNNITRSRSLMRGQRDWAVATADLNYALHVVNQKNPEIPHDHDDHLPNDLLFNMQHHFPWNNPYTPKTWNLVQTEKPTLYSQRSRNRQGSKRRRTADDDDHGPPQRADNRPGTNHRQNQDHRQDRDHVLLSWDRENKDDEEDPDMTLSWNRVNPGHYKHDRGERRPRPIPPPSPRPSDDAASATEDSPEDSSGVGPGERRSPPNSPQPEDQGDNEAEASPPSSPQPEDQEDNEAEESPPSSPQPETQEADAAEESPPPSPYPEGHEANPAEDNPPPSYTHLAHTHGPDTAPAPGEERRQAAMEARADAILRTANANTNPETTLDEAIAAAIELSYRESPTTAHSHILLASHLLIHQRLATADRLHDTGAYGSLTASFATDETARAAFATYGTAFAAFMDAFTTHAASRGHALA